MARRVTPVGAPGGARLPTIACVTVWLRPAGAAALPGTARITTVPSLGTPQVPSTSPSSSRATCFSGPSSRRARISPPRQSPATSSVAVSSTA